MKKSRMAKKGKAESGKAAHRQRFLPIKAAGQNSQGTLAARKPAVGWNLARPSTNGPKPYIAPAKKEPANELTHLRLKIKHPKEAKQTFTTRR